MAGVGARPSALETGEAARPVRDAGGEARARFVPAGFAAAAGWYDPLTRVFSFGLDGWWRRRCLAWSELRPGQRVLDVAAGTGELARQAHRTLGSTGLAVGLDVCDAMLEEARRKLAGDGGAGVGWIQGQAEGLPFRAESFDRVMLGFALRHVEDLDGALGETARVLKPRGRFVIVEWTRPEPALARRLLLGYMRGVVPPLVGLISRDPRVAELARYLPFTIERFISGKALQRRMETAGLAPAGSQEYLFGLVSICVGVKGSPEGAVRPGATDGVALRLPLGSRRSRYKPWVMLASALVLGLVAVQMLLALADLMAR